MACSFFLLFGGWRQDVPLYSLCCMLFTMEGKAGEDARPPFIFLIRILSLYFGRIGVAYQIAAPRLPFALLVVRVQVVRQIGMLGLHFPFCSFLNVYTCAIV